jgi:Ca-activated chloride channel family protein
VRRVGEILDELDLKGKNDELVKELVSLATKHGILTPYTSFLADETANVRDLAANVTRTEGRLRALDNVSGAGGVMQREMKGMYQGAARAPAAQPALERFAAGPAPGADSSGVHFADEAKKEAQAAQQSVRNIGNRTFFRRDGQWVDSRVTREQQSQAKRVKQFSSEYFELARHYGRTMSQYMVFDDPVLITLDDKAYLIEP